MENSFKDDERDQNAEPEALDPVEVPIQALDDVILMRIIEEFVLREGTDYGAQEISLEKKTMQVLKQLESGDVKVFFDPASESINLVQVRKGL